MQDLTRNPDVVPTKVGKYLKNWIPAGVYLGENRAGMKILTAAAIYNQTLHGRKALLIQERMGVSDLRFIEKEE
jgi:hypothetical protein